MRRHAVWLFVCLAYLYVFPYFGRLNNPNENVRVYMTRALVEHHTFAINRIEAEWGWVNDKAVNAGRLYSGKAPGASLLGVPVLFVETKLWHLMGWPSPSQRAATLALRLFATALPLCLFFAWFARHVERRSRSPALRDLSLLGLGLGSMLYPYGVHFVGHAVAAALSCGSFMLLAPADGERPSDRRAAAAGLLAGLGVLFEYQNLFAALLLLGYAGFSRRGGWRSAAAFAAGAVPTALALGAYHAVCFGRPWAFPYGHLENAEFQTVYHSRGYHGLTLPRPAVLGNILFSIDYGLFAFSPFLVIGLVAAIRAAVTAEARREGLLIVALFVVMLLFLSGVGNWRAGWPVGPRYIAVVVPFLALAPALAWRSGGPHSPAPGLAPASASASASASACFWSPRRAAAGGALLLLGLAGALVLVSVVLNGLSGLMFPHFPPQLRNPVFQLAVPLLADGHVPYNAGQLVRLPGRWSLLPLAAAAAATALLAVTAPPSRGSRPAWGWRCRLATAAVAFVVAAAALVGYRAYARTETVTERNAVAFVRSIWEPPPRR